MRRDEERSPYATWSEWLAVTAVLIIFLAGVWKITEVVWGATHEVETIDINVRRVCDEKR